MYSQITVCPWFCRIYVCTLRTRAYAFKGAHACGFVCRSVFAFMIMCVKDIVSMCECVYVCSCEHMCISFNICVFVHGHV